MVAFLRTWTLNIVTVVIFISFVEILFPSSSMKKYIKMVVGLLVILVILNPIIELVYSDLNVEDEIFKSAVLLEREALSQDTQKLQGARNQQMIAIYKDKISDHLRDKICHDYDVQIRSVHIEIEENMESEDFGKIQGISLVLSDGKENKEGQIAIGTVDEISVEVNSVTEKTMSNGAEDSYIISDIKNNISRFYEVDEDNININMDKTSH